MKLYKSIISAVLLVVMAAWLSACGSASPPPTPTPGGTPLHGAKVNPLGPAPDFSMMAADGKPFKLSEQKGKVVLFFFGFTTCPDVCPTTLSALANVRRQLGADAEQTRFAFISFDVERDTLAGLEHYVTGFDPAFIGLRGEQAQVTSAMRKYGATATRRDLPDSALGYTFAHTAYTYVVDVQGRWREVFAFDTPVADMVSDVRTLISEGVAQ
jgi:protein SCO1/2